MEGISQISDELLHKAQSGDQEAFAEIFEFFIVPVYRFIYFRVHDSVKAEKLSEEVFLKIWKSLKKFHPNGKTPFSVWIFQIVHEYIGTFLEQSEKISPERRKFLEARDHQDLTVENSDHQELCNALNELPDTQAESVILKYFCNRENSEIALVLQKTEGAVRILQSRGLKKLREILEGEENVSEEL